MWNQCGHSEISDILLIVYVSCWWTIFLFPPSPTICSLQHFKTYKRKPTLKTFEIKLFGSASTRKWVLHDRRFWNKLLYHCFCCYFIFYEFMLALRHKKSNYLIQILSLWLWRIKIIEVYNIFHTGHTLWVHLSLFSVVIRNWVSGQVWGKKIQR